MPKPAFLTHALEDFAEALEAAGIDPEQVEVSLPLFDWQHLARTLDEERGELVYVGKKEFGVLRYLVRFAAEGR